MPRVLPRTLPWASKRPLGSARGGTTRVRGRAEKVGSRRVDRGRVRSSKKLRRPIAGCLGRGMQTSRGEPGWQSIHRERG